MTMEQAQRNYDHMEAPEPSCICFYCDEAIDEDEVHEYDNETYCASCFEKVKEDEIADNIMK